MAISEKDIKKLWGRAAGHCSAADCPQDCVPFLDPNDPTVIGEMAHIIPRSKDWTRGNGESAGENTYENLILLCPTCHTKVDKAPEHVYDPAKCPPSQARDQAEALASHLTRDINLQSHVVVLTKAEEQEVQFIQNEGCVEFGSWLKTRNRDS